MNGWADGQMDQWAGWFAQKRRKQLTMLVRVEAARLRAVCLLKLLLAEVECET
jgi:hypothetical protein